MDLLMRLFTPRKVFFAVLALGFTQLAVHSYSAARRRFLAWRYPPVAEDGSKSAASDIELESARRRRLHVEALAAQADAALESARGRGDDIRALDEKRRAAAAAAASGDYRKADELLGQIIVETPAAPTGVLPIGKEEADEEEIEGDLPARKTNQFVASGLGPAKRARRRKRR